MFVNQAHERVDELNHFGGGCMAHHKIFDEDELLVHVYRSKALLLQLEVFIFIEASVKAVHGALEANNPILKI